MINTVKVSTDHGRDLHHLADHVTKSPRKKNPDFLAFRFSLQLTNLIVCLMISQNKLHTKVTQTS